MAVFAVENKHNRLVQLLQDEDRLPELHDFVHGVVPSDMEVGTRDHLTRSGSARGEMKTLLAHVAARVGFSKLVFVLDEIGVSMHSTDSDGADGATVLDLAVASKNKKLREWARAYGKFLGRYELVGKQMHATTTSLVVSARDLRDAKDVVLKLMTNEPEWWREIVMRKVKCLSAEPEPEMCEGIPDEIHRAMDKWQVEADSGWVDYSNAIQQQLNDALASGMHSIDVTRGSWKYLIDLVMLTQKNVATEKERRIRPPCECTRIIELLNLDASHVVPVHEAAHLDEDALDFCRRHPEQLQGPGHYQYLLVMPKGDFDLQYALSHFDTIAGVNKAEVVSICRQVVLHLQYLAACGRIHGDIKPRNIVMIDGRWILIDMDAASEIGAPAGRKVTSTACWPPEMTRAQKRRPATTVQADVEEKKKELDKLHAEHGRSRATRSLEEELDSLMAELEFGEEEHPIVASVAFEAWYVGMLMYQLCTSGGLTVWKVDQADNITERERRQLAYQWPEIKDEKLEDIAWPEARQLISWMLEAEAVNRPQSWDAVLDHRFLRQTVVLPECAKVALKRVTAQAKLASEAAVPDLVHLFQMHVGDGCTEADVRNTLKFFAEAAALHMNVDPFKAIGGKPLLQLLCDDAQGRYRNLFETNTGGGSTNKNARRGWETRMFGDAYDGFDTDRPKYGNVNFLTHVRGDARAAQYGSSYMTFRKNVRHRCTITSKDSCNPDAKLGTLEHCAHVLLHKVQMCNEGTQSGFIKVLHHLGTPTHPHALRELNDGVDALRKSKLDYMELQVHGVVQFDEDVAEVSVAEEYLIGGGTRLELSAEEQLILWRRFASRFGVPAFRVSANAKVPLS